MPDRPQDLVESPEELPRDAGGPDDVGGRVAAIAHLSFAYARAVCAEQALADHGISPTDGEHHGNAMALAGLQAFADTIAAPLGIANVLQAIEETIEQPGRNIHATTRGRELIVRAMADARADATEDETRA